MDGPKSSPYFWLQHIQFISKVKILQNFVAFSECMNFKALPQKM